MDIAGRSPAEGGTFGHGPRRRAGSIVRWASRSTAGLPFHSLALAAAALAIVVGLPMALTAYRASTGRTRTGKLLVVWLGVQLPVIRTFSWPQPVMAAAGVAIVRLVGACPSAAPRT